MVAMQIQRTGWPQYAAHLHDAVPHPVDVDLYPALPPVLKGADLGFVPPDNLVVAVAEEGRVKVDEVYGLGWKSG